MLLVDLTEESSPRERPLANDQRGYGVILAGPQANGQVYRLRLIWSASDPSERRWVRELRLPDGRWYGGTMVTYMGASVSALAC